MPGSLVELLERPLPEQLAPVFCGTANLRFLPLANVRFGSQQKFKLQNRTRPMLQQRQKVLARAQSHVDVACAKCGRRTSFDAEKILQYWNRLGLRRSDFPSSRIRFTCDINCSVVVNRLLTTATTRPVQSSTGAPEAP